MTYNPQIHHRKSIRLKGYDYSREGLYFITLCVQNRLQLFGKIKNGKTELNIFGKIAKEEWKKSTEIRKNISLGEFITMPNHFHGIIKINYSLSEKNHSGEFKSPTQTIGAIIRGFKGATTKRIKILISQIKTSALPADTGELQFAPNELEEIKALIEKIDPNKSIWQRNYYERIIRDDTAYRNISNYIRNNPKKWEEDKFNNLK